MMPMNVYGWAAACRVSVLPTPLNALRIKYAAPARQAPYSR
jgi:hypothetical protein